nr:amidohydrolase family protein [Saccharospirillum impatiens]
MDAAGIDHGVLSLAGLFGVDTLPASEAVPLLTGYNRDLAELCRTYPKRFSGLAALPLQDLDQAKHELETAIASGLIGAILPIDAFRSPTDVAILHPLLACLNRLGAHLFLHPGPWPGRTYPAAIEDVSSPLNTALRHSVLSVQAAVSEAMLTLCLTDCLSPYPDLTVQVANLGGNLAWLVERMDHLQQLRAPDSLPPGEQLGRVCVDTATFGPRAIDMAAEVFGVDRLLFGTDAPIFDRDQSRNGLEASRVGSDVLAASWRLLTRYRTEI